MTDVDLHRVDKKPTDAKVSPDGEHMEFPTRDLPGTDHPNPPKTDQQGIKGVDPKSETGTPSESTPSK